MRVLLAAALVSLHSSCVGVRDSELRTVKAPAPPPAFSAVRLEGISVRTLVYSPGAAAKTEDEALETLIREGFVPVIVDVSNAGPGPAELSRLRLTLDDSGRLLSPIANEALPAEFEKFNPAAVAANVYNTGAVVVGAAAYMTALAVALVVPCRSMKVPCTDSPMFELTERAVERFKGPVYNHVSKTTAVDYGGYLWSPRTLASGENATGLLFFRAKNPSWSALRLKAELAPL